MAKSTVDQKALQADIEAMKKAKNKDEVDQIKKKYDGALKDMKAEKEAPKKKEPKPLKTVTAPAPKNEKPQKKEAAKKEAPKKETPAKKETAKKETPKKETAKKEAPKKETAKKTPAKKEAPKKEAGDRYSGKYEISQFDDGASYRLKASNGEILVTSELYTTRDGVLKAIENVKKNVETGDINVFADKHGNWKFVLKAKNHRVLAISSNYTSQAGAQRAAESFKKFALKAVNVDIENPEDSDFKAATPIEVNYKDVKQGGKYVIENDNGDYSWDLKASNGQILCQAEGFTSKASVMNAIESFKKNVVEGTFKCVKDKNNNFEYKLYSPSGRVVAIGEAYSSKDSAESAAQSVVSFFNDAKVVEGEE